jgi:hypothetical protein
VGEWSDKNNARSRGNEIGETVNRKKLLFINKYTLR